MEKEATRFKREEARKMARTLADEWLEDIEKGREEGMKLGALRAKQDGVLQLLEEKFGHIPARVEKRVRALEDTEALDVLLKQVLHADSLDAMGL